MRIALLMLGVVVCGSGVASAQGEIEQRQHYPDIAGEVVFENDQVRLLEYHGKQGDKAAMHSHPNAVAYAITDIAAKFTFPDGQSMDIATEATGSGESRVLLFELK